MINEHNALAKEKLNAAIRDAVVYVGVDAKLSAPVGAAPKAAAPTDEAANSADEAPEFSEDQIALAFVAPLSGAIIYVSRWARWLRWDGKRWADDDTLHVFDLIRKACREFAGRCVKETAAATLASSRTVAGVEKLARADRRVAGTTDQWDAESWSLNTPDGLINLRGGKTVKHDPLAYCRKITAVGPRGDCPRWLAFIERITAGDESYARYLQRVAGYCLTGETTEHALFFGYGTGANGKSVFISTLAGILASYHRTAPIETFTASQNDHHPTEIANLHGARLVTATETEEGRRWAESRIKSLTGGDKISARYMRQDFFEFQPAFKLFAIGNHQPGLRSVDESIRRRFHLIPFAVTIPPEERDSNLAEKLRDEWPGILAWMLEGCLEWQQIGLAPPPVVITATAAYLDGEDALSAWIDERCEYDANCWEPLAALFGSWTDWCAASGEFAGSNRRFANNLESRGFAPFRKTSGRGFRGLRVKAPTTNFQGGHYND